MPSPSDTLGGRLPLLDPRALSSDQERLYERLRRTLVPWAEASGFRAQVEGGRLIGPFNPILFSPGVAAAFLDLQEAEAKHTTLTERVRQVVILSVAAAWGSAYALYAHRAVARKAGLSEEAIRELAEGALPADLSDQEKVAQRYTRQLSVEHRVAPGLYGEAEAAFGRQGLVDLVVLAGCYHLVCFLLNGFAIPAPDRMDGTVRGSGASLGVDAMEEPMPADQPTLAQIATVATFPDHYFLENLAVRGDGSILVTAFNRNELWYVPPTSGEEVGPLLMHTFDPPPLSLVEAEPDLFYLCVCNYFTTHESFLQRLDLRGWAPGTPIEPEVVLEFPEPRRSLNGSCLVAPGVLLVADSFADLVWRVDLPRDGRGASVRVWLQDDSMSHEPETPQPKLPGVPQPGVNGLKFAARSGFLYYTSTIRELFVRVRVDPRTQEPAGEPEVLARGHMADDFCLDEEAGFAYLATHRENTIVRLPLEPGGAGGRVIVGDPFTDRLVGPSSLAWGRGLGEHGRVAYVTTDGGHTMPPLGQPVRPAKLVRMQILEAAGSAKRISDRGA